VVIWERITFCWRGSDGEREACALILNNNHLPWAKSSIEKAKFYPSASAVHRFMPSSATGEHMAAMP